MVCVNNYLIYGLRDQYMRLLKKLDVIDYKIVGLKVLENIIDQCPANFFFELSSDDMIFLKNKGDNTEDLNEKIDDEIKISCLI